MHIICDKSKLIEGMNIVMKAIPGKTTMMILECVVIEVKDNQIKLIANDLQLGIETLIDGEIKQEGSVAVGAKVFFEIIRKLPSDNVSITVDEDYHMNIKLWIRQNSILWQKQRTNFRICLILSKIKM